MSVHMSTYVCIKGKGSTTAMMRLRRILKGIQHSAWVVPAIHADTYATATSLLFYSLNDAQRQRRLARAGDTCKSD